MGKIKYLPIISRAESCKLAVSDICYVSRCNRKLYFETDHGRMSKYGKMDDLEKMLGPEFFRCMSGCMVNLSRIQDMKSLSVYFDNGKSFSMGKESFLKLKQRFNAYLMNLLDEE